MTPSPDLESELAEMERKANAIKGTMDALAQRSAEWRGVAHKLAHALTARDTCSKPDCMTCLAIKQDALREFRALNNAPPSRQQNDEGKETSRG